MQIKIQLLNALLSLVVLYLLLFSAKAMAEDRKEMYLRTGLVTGSFQGKEVTGGTFTADVVLQADVWFYQSTHQATVFQMLLANESGIGRARYYGSGVGQRYFLKEAMLTEDQAGSDFLSIKPGMTYYLGWDVDLAQFLVVPLSDTLASYGTIVDVGGVAGARKVATKNLSIDVSAGYKYGYSISSSVSVTTTIFTVLLGIGYSF